MGREESINAYLELRTQLDERCETLNSKHTKQMQCKAGCDSCCESIRVFPVEFEAIKEELKRKNNTLPTRRVFGRFRKSCVFLIEGECSIYDSRPIICRTQGLPLLYQNQDGTSYELSVCHLNFEGVDINYFNVENALYMPEYNSRLYLINQAMVDNPQERIPLYRLLK